MFFFYVLFITLSGTPQLAVMLRNRATFFKQRDAGLYTATAYAWSAALVQVRKLHACSLRYADLVAAPGTSISARSNAADCDDSDC